MHNHLVCITALVVGPQPNEMIYWFSFAGLCFIIMLHIVQNHKWVNLGFWQTLASKAKGILDKDGLARTFKNWRKEQPCSNTVHPENIRWGSNCIWRYWQSQMNLLCLALSLTSLILFQAFFPCNFRPVTLVVHLKTTGRQEMRHHESDLWSFENHWGSFWFCQLA